MDKIEKLKAAWALYFSKNKGNCTGCSACMAMCPVQCISMIPDEEGFLYPHIDEKKCKRCYVCVKACAR